MKNNKILYLLTILITLFSFNMKANAEDVKTMTCMYRAFSQELELDSIAFIQYVSGKKNIYKLSYKETLDINNKNWFKSNASFSIYSSNEANASQMTNKLTKCPEKVVYSDTRNHYDIYIEDSNWDEKNWKNNSLYLMSEEYDYIPKFTLVQSISPQNVTNPSSDDLIQLEKSPYTLEEYTGFCKYRRMINDTDTHYIQVNLGKKDILFTEYDPFKNGFSGESMGTDSDGQEHEFKISNDLTYADFYGENNGNCPSQIIVQRIHQPKGDNNYNDIHLPGGVKTIVFKDYKDAHSSNAESYILYAVNGSNPLTGEELTLEASFGDTIKFGDISAIENCKDLFGDEMYGYINIIWNVIKIGIPIILIILGVIDFAQAIFSGKEDGMKKAQGKFIKRIMLAVIILVVPSLLGILLEIANSVWDNIGTDICGILF